MPTTSKFVIGHGSIKVPNPKATGDEEKFVYLTAGDVAELDEGWVKKNDPRGVQFIAVERFEKLHAAKVAADALRSKHEEEQAKLSADQKAELARIERVQDKHLAAIATAIKAKKVAPKAAEKKDQAPAK